MSKSATLSCIGRKSHVQTTCSLTSVLLVVPRELYTSYPAPGAYTLRPILCPVAVGISQTPIARFFAAQLYRKEDVKRKFS